MKMMKLTFQEDSSVWVVFTSEGHVLNQPCSYLLLIPKARVRHADDACDIRRLLLPLVNKTKFSRKSNPRHK